MTKQKLEILDFEDKKTQAGQRYTRFKTSAGWMSCFNVKAAEELKKKENQGTVSVDVKTVGKFNNIDKYLGEADTQTKDEGDVEIEEVGKTKEGNSTDRVDRAKALEIAQGDIEKAKVYFKYITEGV